MSDERANMVVATLYGAWKVWAEAAGGTPAPLALSDLLSVVEASVAQRLAHLRAGILSLTTELGSLNRGNRSLAALALERVTREDVRRAAIAYLKPQNRTTGLFLPTPAPDRAPLAQEEPGPREDAREQDQGVLEQVLHDVIERE